MWLVLLALVAIVVVRSLLRRRARERRLDAVKARGRRRAARNAQVAVAVQKAERRRGLRRPRPGRWTSVRERRVPAAGTGRSPRTRVGLRGGSSSTTRR